MRSEESSSLEMGSMRSLDKDASSRGREVRAFKPVLSMHMRHTVWNRVEIVGQIQSRGRLSPEN